MKAKIDKDKTVIMHEIQVTTTKIISNYKLPIKISTKPSRILAPPRTR